MREIKFKAWAKNKMWDIEEMDFSTGFLGIRDSITKKGEGIFGFDKANILQFTGLKDKLGKEIYEGDIIQPEDSKKDVVIFSDGLFHRKHETTKTPIRNLGEIEVIGNIYENPELLK